MKQPGPEIRIIVAVANDGAIGRRGDLVFRLRDDMRHFRQLTTGHTIIMGRRTWESLPKGALPQRHNIVISRNKAYRAPGAEVFHSLDDALKTIEPEGIAYIIGGAQIYEQALERASQINITQIHATAPDADTHFPTLNPDITRLEDFRYEDFTLTDYDPHPHIKGEVAV